MALMAISFNSFSQTVTAFAGQENGSEPWKNYDNITVDNPKDAYFYEPAGLDWDPNGNLYIVERNKVRLYNGAKIYNRAGGLGDPTFSHDYQDGTGNAAKFFQPTSIACNSKGEGFIVDSQNNSIRKISTYQNAGNGQIVTTFAGPTPSGKLNDFGKPGTANGTGSAARFDTPKGICIGNDGNFYVTDYNNFTIRKITPAGVVTTLAGSAGNDGDADGTSGTSARFGGPYGVAPYDANHIIVTDNWNTSIRKVNTSTGKTTTICGKFGQNFVQDGTLADARFKEPRGIAVVNGLIYVADGSTIRVIDEANNKVSTFAGSKDATGNTDGVGANARFGRLGELAYDGKFTLYVTDIYYNVIKAVTLDDLMPNADFTASKTSLEINEITTITDQSTGATVKSRQWTIQNLSGSSSNVVVQTGDLNSSAQLEVKFTAADFYNVKLMIENDFGTSEKVKNSYINVSVTGTVTAINEEDLVNIYPNPVTNSFVNVSSPLMLKGESTIRITDQSGRVIYSENLSGVTETKVDLTGVQTGIYFVEIGNSAGTATRKIVIQ